MKHLMPNPKDLDETIQSFSTGNIPFYKGYDYIPRFKKYIWEKYNSKLVVTAAIRCSDLLTASYATKFRLDHQKYQEFLEQLK